MSAHLINVIQTMVSLPAELLGFCLALIEIRFPSLATYFRESIIEAGISVQRQGFFAEMFQYWGSRRDALKNIAMFLLIFAASVVVANNVYLHFGTKGVIIFYLIAVAGPLVLVFAMGPVLRFILRQILKFVSTFAAGHEIGTLGLMIAAVGIVSEGIQVMSILMSASQGAHAESIGEDAEFVAVLILSMVLITGLILVVRGVLAYRYPRLRIRNNRRDD